MLPAEAEPLRRLGQGVYILQSLPHGNRVLVVEFNDYLVVCEATGSSAVSEVVLQRLDTKFPAKSVRYIAFSHSHYDHADGLRPYIARGATVLTTPGNQNFVKRIAHAQHSLLPDALQRSPQEPKIELIQAKRTLDDGQQRLDLYVMGPNSHVQDMVIASVPKERLIFEGDLFVLPAHGKAVPPSTVSVYEFAAWLRKSELVVERIADVHGRVATIDELRRAVATRSRENHAP